MKWFDKEIALVHLGQDFIGREFFSMHHIPDGRKTSGTIKAQPVLGMIYIPDPSTGEDPTIVWSGVVQE